MLLEISSINCIILSRDFCCRKAGAVSSAMQKGDLLQQETKWSGQQSGRTEKGWSRKQNRRLFPEKCVSKDFCNNRLANFSSSLLPAMKTLLGPLKSRRRVGSPFFWQSLYQNSKSLSAQFLLMRNWKKDHSFSFVVTYVRRAFQDTLSEMERGGSSQREKRGLKKQGGKGWLCFLFWEDFPLGPSCLGGGVGSAGESKGSRKGKS